LLDIETLHEYDKQNMHKIYDNWPQIALEQFEANSNDIDFEQITHVIFSGMGGSGAIGDIFSSILSKTNIHVEVVKGYLLPKTANSKSLVVTTSISGNTEETLSILQTAHERKCKTISFSGGGKMEKYCLKNNLHYKKIPMIHSPRASFTGFLFGILRVLEPFLPIEKKDIFDAINELEKLKEKISSQNITDDNPAISLAEWITDIPLIYYPWGLQASAIRFKNSLQENSKIHAVTEDVIESCHNGIVAWDKTSMLKPILMQGDDDYIKTKERWNILKEFFDKKNIEYKEIFSVKGNILSKLISLIYFCDYVTIYRAVLNKTDPTPVDAIEYIKKRL